MINSEISLIKAFEKSLMRNSVDTSMDLTKESVDALIENSGLVEGTPVIKAICSAGKTFMPVSDKLLCKRVAVFLQAFNRAELPQVKKDKHNDNLDRDKDLDSEYEQVLIFIEQCSNFIQAQYLGRFYAAYWNSDFSWDRFLELAEANTRMFIGDYSVLQSAAGNNIAALAAGDKEAAVIRLASLGLIFDMRQKDSGISLTEFGICFSTYLESVKSDVVTDNKILAQTKGLSEDEDPFESLILDKQIFAKPKTEEEEPAETEEPEKEAEPAVLKMPELKIPEVEKTVEQPAEPEESKVETPQPVPEYSPFKPVDDTGSSDNENTGPFKMTTERPEPEQPKPPLAADPAMFRLNDSTRQEVKVSDNKSGSLLYKSMGLGDPDSGSQSGTATLGSYFSMDNNGDHYGEQTKLGSFSSLGADDTEEKLPQREDSSSRFFPIKPASSNGTASPERTASSPSPFRKVEPTKQEPEASDAPQTPSVSSPFMPLGSNNANDTSSETMSPFKPLDT